MFLWTLTYKMARTLRRQVKEDWRRFTEDLQAIFGRMPMVAVVERGRKGSKRLHVHFAVDRWLPVSVVRRVWRRGFVWVGDPGKLAGEPGVDQLSGYLSKYVAKQYDGDDPREGDRDKREHRYHVTQGWQVPRIRAWYRRAVDALLSLERRYGVADVLLAFGEDHPDEVHGYWLHYPDNLLYDPPGLFP